MPVRRMTRQHSTRQADSAGHALDLGCNLGHGILWGFYTWTSGSLNLIKFGAILTRELIIEILVTDRVNTARRGQRLEYFSIAWNMLEGLLSVLAGILAGSIALVGFGIDSFIEVTSAGGVVCGVSVGGHVLQTGGHVNPSFHLRCLLFFF